jgi:hypothetical protein
MVQAMFLAHLLGDYVLQTDALARWKSRSVWGVLVHSAVVTFSLWLCSLPFTLDWWPYALAIGAAHVLIDTARVKVGPVGPAATLILFLADQAAHALTVGLSLAWSGWLRPHPAQTNFGAWLQDGHRLAFIVGYVLLTMPAWVWVHFVVRGTGAKRTSLPGRPGEKYVGMIERGLIATFVLAGQFTLIPLVVTPRLVLDGRNGHVNTEHIGYLNELLISVGLAVAVGLFLKGLH